HGVDARGDAGQVRRRSLCFGRSGHQAQNLLLVRPDDKPDIERHDQGKPHADADRVDGLMECQRLDQVAFMESQNEAKDDRSERGVAKPEHTLGAMNLVIAARCSAGSIFGTVGVCTKFRYQSRPIHMMPAMMCSQRQKNSHQGLSSLMNWPVSRPTKTIKTISRTTPATNVL